MTSTKRNVAVLSENIEMTSNVRQWRMNSPLGYRDTLILVNCQNKHGQYFSVHILFSRCVGLLWMQGECLNPENNPEQSMNGEKHFQFSLRDGLRCILESNVIRIANCLHSAYSIIYLYMATIYIRRQ